MISIIIPVYNSGIFLEECISSILEQDYRDFELILVDDGSTDKSPEIIDSYADQDKRIIAIHQTNAGAAAARNTGIERAKGKYIAFVDSDDFIEPDFLKRMLESIESADADLAVCGFEPFGTANPPKVKSIQPGTVNRETAICYCLGYNSFNGYVWNKLYRLSILKENQLRFEDGYFPCEDILFTGKYIACCSTAVIISDRLYHYRQNQSGANRGRYSEDRNYDKSRMNSLRAAADLADFYQDPEVSDACRMHNVRESGIILRSMAAGKYKGPEYNKLIGCIRRDARLFLAYDDAGLTQKASVFLTCISPALELKIWRILNRH